MGLMLGLFSLIFDVSETVLGSNVLFCCVVLSRLIEVTELPTPLRCLEKGAQNSFLSSPFFVQVVRF